MMDVGITTVPKFRANTPRVMFDVSYFEGGWFSPELHLSEDGERFVIVTQDETWGVATEIKIVLNWLDELKRLTAEAQ